MAGFLNKTLLAELLYYKLDFPTPGSVNDSVIRILDNGIAEHVKDECPLILPNILSVTLCGKIQYLDFK